MRQRIKGSGARQRLWDALMNADDIRMDDLTDKADATGPAARAYIGALIKRGYIDVIDQQYEGRALIRKLRLVRRTGARSPSWNIVEDSFRDWNIDPAMSGEHLRELIGVTGLSIGKWLQAMGMNVHYTTRVRQMINGQRAVPDDLAEKAERLARSYTAQEVQ